MMNLTLLKKCLNYCPIVGFMVVLASLLFRYSTVQQWALIFTGVTYALDYVISQRWKSWKWTRDKWVYVVCILFFLLFPLWILLGIETGPDLHTDMETYLPFAILGVVGILGMPEVKKLEWFAAVALAMVCGVVVYIIGQVEVGRLLEDINCGLNVFNAYRMKYITSHMHFNLFANMALILGIAACQQPRIHRGWRIGLVAGMLVTIFPILISEGRTGVATMLMIVGCSLLWFVWKRSRVTAVVMAIVGSVLVGGIMIHSMSSHYANLSEEPRQYIWSVAWEMIEEHPFRAYGPSNGHELFVERGMQDADFMEYYGNFLRAEFPEWGDEIVHMAHPHNVFLETAIAYGILGVVVLALVFLLPILLAEKHNRLMVVLCQLTFLIQGMFEKMGDALNPLLWLIVLLLLLDRPSTCSEQLPCR